MKITLCTPEIHAELTALYNDYPGLRFQNVGYQYIRQEVREANAKPLARIEEILKEHIVGFARFLNFYTRESGLIDLRFEYNWGEENNTMYFTGVGYLPIDHLRDGFPKDTAYYGEVTTTQG